MHSLLGEARRYVLDDIVARGLSQTVESAPSSIERNLDFLRLPSPVTWLEWRQRPRIGAGGQEVIVGARQPDRVGALLCERPGDSERIVTVVAWGFSDGTVHHSYATMVWSLPHLANLSIGARRLYGRGREESIARMMTQANAFLPLGFREEVDFIEGLGDGRGAEELTAGAMRDVTAESIYLMAALLFIESSAASLSATDAGDGEGRSHSVATGPVRRRLWPVQKRGFVRRCGRLDWLSPGV